MRKSINENGLEYRLEGDVYLPDLTLPQVHHPIGKWGRLHRDYLKEHRPVRYETLVLSGKPWSCLAELNEQAEKRLTLIVEQMKTSEGVTEELKASDPMAWVGAMNSIRNRAEEIVLHELIWEDAR